MKHLKHHAMHLLMCAPMLVIGAVLLIGGAGLSSLVPVVGCVLMMGMMMQMMGGMGGDKRGPGPGNDPS